MTDGDVCDVMRAAAKALPHEPLLAKLAADYDFCYGLAGAINKDHRDNQPKPDDDWPFLGNG